MHFVKVNHFCSITDFMFTIYVIPGRGVITNEQYENYIKSYEISLIEKKLEESSSFRKAMNTDKKIIMDKLNQFHYDLLKLVFEDKLILSDVHYGNILLTEDNELSMIDPAQLTNISTNELNLLIWLLVMISSTENIKKHFNTFIEKLNLFNKIYCESNVQELNNIKNTLYNTEKTRDRFKNLLVELEKINIKVPVSLFAFAKLYDTIQSQREKYDFDKDYNNIDSKLKELIKKNMTWSDIYKYFV